eukprot:4798305-Amphidinium_carterae.1
MEDYVMLKRETTHAGTSCSMLQARLMNRGLDWLSNIKLLTWLVNCTFFACLCESTKVPCA